MSSAVEHVWPPLRSLLEQLCIDLSKEFSTSNQEPTTPTKDLVKRNRRDISARLCSIDQVVKVVLSDDDLRKEFFGSEFRLFLGHIFFVLLQIFENSSLEPSNRAQSGSILRALTDVKWTAESGDTLAVVLPGVVFKCKKITLSGLNSSTHLEIVELSIKVLAGIICSVFKDGSSSVDDGSSSVDASQIDAIEISKNEGDKNNLNKFKRTASWYKTASNKISSQVAHLLSRLCKSSSHRILLATLDMVTELRTHCKNIIGQELDTSAADLCIFLFDNQHTEVHKMVNQLSDSLRRDCPEVIATHSASKLNKLFHALAKKSDVYDIIQNIINLLALMGSDLLDRLLISATNFLYDLLTSVMSVISINTSRLSISSSSSPSGTFLSANMIDFSLPLNHGLTAAKILALSKELVKLKNLKAIIEFLADRCLNNTTIKGDIESCVSSAYILLALSLALRDEDSTNIPDSHTKKAEECFLSYINDYVDVLRTVCNVCEANIEDDQIESYFTSHSDYSSLATILIYTTPVLVHFSRDKRKSREIVGNSLYAVLECCSSYNVVIRDVAEMTLVAIAKECDQSVADLLIANSQLIILRASLQCRDFAVNYRSPLVVSQFMNRCSSPIAFTNIKHIIDELLLALDRNNQKKTLLLLRAIRDYMRGLRKCFPEFTPPSESGELDESGEKPPIFDKNALIIKCTVSVLNRTKHMISSIHVPIQILVLDILDESLQIVRNYENELLPMIHQNWHGVVRKFDVDWIRLTEAQKLVASKTVDVIKTMCELSGNFMSRKMMDDFVPRIIEFLDSFGTKTSINLKRPLIADEKLLVAVVKGIPIFTSKCNLSSDVKEKLLRFSQIQENG